MVRPCYFGLSLNQKNEKEYLEHSYDFVFTPFEVSGFPKRYAISYRNKFMAQNCDFMICFVQYSLGGARAAMKMAQKSGKTVFNLTEE